MSQGNWANLKKGSPEYRKHDREQRAAVRAAEHAERDEAARQPSSTKELKKSEAQEILRERIRNSHVLDVVTDLAEIAARQHKIPFNHYLVTNGLRATLAARNGQEIQPHSFEPDAVVDGEVLYKQDLFALWDFGYFRQPEVTFEAWLDTRRNCKSDVFFLGKEVFGKDFHEVHQGWTAFFPQFDPTGLKPGYSQEHAKTWLARQSEKKTFVLLCSRNSYKSTFSLVWAVTAILCQPCIRIRLVTETRDLADDFVGSLRNYFELQQPDSPTLFQQLFPEFCIAPDDGKKNTYECPLRHLSLVAATAEASSMDASQAGRRCDILLCDDIVSDQTTGTDKMLEQGINRFDLLQKLVEVAGLTVSLATPWHKKDVSGVLIERADVDPDTLTAVRIDPAWEVLPHAKHKPTLDLREDDVRLLFPERLTFKFLMSEARKNLRLFESQNLCRFPDDDKFKINFDLETLNQAVRPFNYFQDGSGYQLVGTFAGIDTAWSISKFADYSALIAAKVYKNLRTEKYLLAVTDIRIAQLRIPELAQEIVRFIQANRPTNVVIERSGAWQSLQQAIAREAAVQQIALPSIYWRPTNLGNQNQKQKMARIKALEVPLAAGELVFMQHSMLEELFDQLVRCDGSRSTPTRKDDLPDALSLLHEQYFASLGGTKVTTKEDFERQEQEYADRVRRGWYEIQFGSSVIPYTTPKSAEPEQITATERYFGGLVRQ